MADIIQWNVRGLGANFEELRLLCNQYNPQVVAVQECQLRKDKIINLTGFSGITKSSRGDDATGGVTLCIKNPSCSVTLNLTLTCRPSRSECQPRRL